MMSLISSKRQLILPITMMAMRMMTLMRILMRMLMSKTRSLTRVSILPKKTKTRAML